MIPINYDMQSTKFIDDFLLSKGICFIFQMNVDQYESDTNNFDLLPGKYNVASGQFDVTLVDDGEEEIPNLL